MHNSKQSLGKPSLHVILNICFMRMKIGRNLTLYVNTMFNSYLSNVSLYNAYRIYQDVSGQPLYLLPKSSTEQLGCEGQIKNKILGIFATKILQKGKKEKHLLCLSGRTWLAIDLT